MKENMADTLRDGTRAIGERNGLSKLTTEQVLAIRQDTRTQRVIAEEYGTTQTNVKDIKLRRSWKHI